jgi:hypothetical protein
MQMPLTLCAALIPSYIQILESVSRLVTKAEAYCAEKSIDPQELISARLTEDMLPFAFQVQQTGVLSIGAIEGVRNGVFSPNNFEPPNTFAGLKARVEDTVTRLEAVTSEEMESFIGREVRFQSDRHFDFLAENFLLSVAQPSFYFHATTAYNILRMKGLPIGKADYAGHVRIKRMPA